MKKIEMQYNIKVNNISFSRSLPPQKVKEDIINNKIETINIDKINRSTWSDFMQHSINNQLQCNLTL